MHESNGMHGANGMHLQRILRQTVRITISYQCIRAGFHGKIM